jgi:hypothetical protein
VEGGNACVRNVARTREARATTFVEGTTARALVCDDYVRRQFVCGSHQNLYRKDRVTTKKKQRLPSSRAHVVAGEAHNSVHAE